VSITVWDDTHPACHAFKTGDTFAGAYLAEALDPLPARPTQILARLSDESPVIVASSFGKGQTLFVGSFLGLAQQQTPSAANRRWILGLLLWAEVVPPIICTSERPENPKPSIRLHESPGGFVVFVLNYDDKPQRFRLELRLPDSHFSWRDLITHETGTVERTPATAMSLQLTVPARDVRVLSLARKNP
jgi:beta-galactosidase